MPINVRVFIHDHHGYLALAKGQFILLCKRLAEDTPFFLVTQNVFHAPGGPHRFHSRSSESHFLIFLIMHPTLSFSTFFKPKTQPFSPFQLFMGNQGEAAQPPALPTRRRHHQ